MQYSYQGGNYYIEYSNSDNANCFNFVTRTITNGGAVKSGEYWRR